MQLITQCAAVPAPKRRYTRPTILDDSAPPQLHIVGGRHPVLDMTMGGSFVPNDTHLEVGMSVRHERGGDPVLLC